MFARAMRILAMATFVIGTLIFLLCYFIGGVFLTIGFGYAVVAGLVNLPLFSITLSMGIKQRNKNLLASAALLLLNAPAMFVYIRIIV